MKASSNPTELIGLLRERKSLAKALKAECSEPVRTYSGDEDCLLCTKGVSEDDYVIFGEGIVTKPGKGRCDCTIIHVRTEGEQAVISLILLEIKPNLANSLNKAKEQLKDTHEATKWIFKGLAKRLTKSFANSRLDELFVIMCPRVRRKELEAIEKELRLNVEGLEYPIIYLECGEHLVRNLVQKYSRPTPPPSTASARGRFGRLGRGGSC